MCPDRSFEERSGRPPVLVSACLVGFRCRYDGRDATAGEVRERFLSGKTLPLCPEQLGGLGTPRPAAHLEPADRPAVELPEVIASSLQRPIAVEGGGAVFAGRARVVTDAGTDVTEAYLRGAFEVARATLVAGVQRAYLKTSSPSCDDRLGVTAALLAALGVEIIPTDRDREETA